MLVSSCGCNKGMLDVLAVLSVHPLALDEKMMLNMAESRTCCRCSVKAISVWWLVKEQQRAEIHDV